jgi:hypothetical protein
VYEEDEEEPSSDEEGQLLSQQDAMAKPGVTQTHERPQVSAL